MYLNKRLVTLVSIILGCIINECFAEFKKICYFTNWAQFRPTGAEFYPEDIDPKLCTHVIYAFGKIQNYSLANTEQSDLGIDNGPGMYERIMVLKLINPKLKIMLSVSDWTQSSIEFNSVVENEYTMQIFAKNSMVFLRKYNFDGLDIDFKFPLIKKNQFTQLLEILRNSFDQEDLNSSNGLELSIAVSARKATIESSYEIDKISRSVDFVNLIAYDFHGSWNSKTGFHSALYSKTDDLSFENSHNADWAVNYWLKNGCPKEKLILGLAFYGRGFKLHDYKHNLIGSHSMGPSKAGQYTKESGVLSYFEICQIIKENNLVEKVDTEYGAVGLTYGNEWIGYENQETIVIKANYIKDKSLGGAMIWTIDFDDFKGNFCNQGTYPLMKILNHILDDSHSSSTMKPAKTTDQTTSKTSFNNNHHYHHHHHTQSVRTKATTVPDIPKNFCSGSENSYITSQNNCEFFQVCMKGFSNPIATIKCPNSYWFNLNEQTCVKNKPSYCQMNLASTSTNFVSTTKTQTISIINKLNENFRCPEPSGLFENVQDPNKFWHCSNNYAYLKNCPGNLIFDRTLKICATKSRLIAKTSLILNSSTKKVMESKRFLCPKPNGLFKNTDSYDKFWHCSNNIAFLKQCSGNLIFDENLGVCNFNTERIQRSI